MRKRDKDRGRHIWIVDPPYSRLRRSVIGLPCKIGLKIPYSRLRRSVIGLPCKIEMVREKERQKESKRERERERHLLRHAHGPKRAVSLAGYRTCHGQGGLI